MSAYEIELIEPGEPTAIRALPRAPRRLVQFDGTAARALAPLLARYQRTVPDYLRGIGIGREAPLWAVVFLDREYRLAVHVVRALTRRSRIRFSPYARLPESTSAASTPGVGILLIPYKADLLAVAGSSPLFTAAWHALARCDADRRWLTLLEPLPAEWVADAEAVDAQRCAERGDTLRGEVHS